MPPSHSYDTSSIDGEQYYFSSHDYLDEHEHEHESRRPNQDTPSTTWRSYPHQSPDDSVLDSLPPANADMSDRRHSQLPQPPRDSHDLSLSSRDVTRDSLVTNMLLSLDQISISQTNSLPRYQDQNDDEDDIDSPRFFDVPRYRPANQIPSSPSVQWKGHGHSYSSDLEGVGDESSRMSSQYSRGRRSNSSTNFPDTSSRLNNGRPPTTSRNNNANVSANAHARGGRGSKSSSVGSLDGGHIQGNGLAGQRSWGGAKAGRTASFDNGSLQMQSQMQMPVQTRGGQKQAQAQAQAQVQQAYPHLQDVPQSPFRTDFIDDFLNDDLDVAPTPTVPSGPRRSPSTPIISRPPPEPKDISSSHRNRSSSRSVKSSSGRGKTNTREPPPPLPMTTSAGAADAESAPAPHVGYGKPKPKEPEQPTKATTPAAPPPPKEKQGFFKRVFGGGSSKSTPAKNPPADTLRSSRVDTQDSIGTDKSGGNSTPQHPTSALPVRETVSAHSNHPTLQKKSSSFFRRRKRSATNDAPHAPSQEDVPPVPALDLSEEKNRGIAKAEASPVSSLRQVMNPYLRHSAAVASHADNVVRSNNALADITNVVGGRDDQGRQREEYQREFSPDYEPSPNARIRKVHSNLEQDHDDLVSTPSKSPPVKGAKGSSFLDLDGGSDNDDDHSLVIRDIAKVTSEETESVTTPLPKKKSSFIKLSSNEDSAHPSNLTLPLASAQGSRAGSPRPPSRTPELRVQTSVETTPKRKAQAETTGAKGLDEPDFVVGDPTEDDKYKAQKIYDGNEDFIQKEKAAAWMGEAGPVRQRTLRAYMELYDFANQSVIYSLRQVCNRLVLRGETQQVDRILDSFSKRWCECNPNHGFKATDVIHTICYSIMLLNTDLHMADIEQKMTRSQFVKNTMGTVTQALAEAAPDAFEKRPSILPEKNPALGVKEATSPAPTEIDKRSFRNSFRPPPRRDSDGELLSDCGPLVKNPYYGTMKGWEEEVEVVLKGIYTSIRDERLPLFGADPAKSLPPTPSTSNLSVMGMLKRTPSVLSKAPSEGNLSMRGRNVESSRGPASRWASKSRSRPAAGRHGFNSSRTSFDDGNSLFSPTMSSATWSRQSLGRTQTSMSQDSFGSSMPRGDYQQSIGFANALSQAIIKDEDSLGNEMAPSILSADISSTQLLEDESLELTGPPWVKEGMVIHKHHLDGVDKKAKERNWTEVFAVIQKGQMSLFSFNASKSMRQKSRTRSSKQQGPVGGGNWQDNATNLGTFSLRQTLASALPPPGYSRTRPHVWALSLPTGAVHLFQVGTAEIIKEFVTTANYWSARLSTHPLTGGVSNIEYGWSDSIVNNALVSAINESTTNTPGRGGPRPGSSAANGRKSSISSFRSASIDQATAAFTHASGRGKLPGDRVHIAEWAPPAQSMRPSTLPESEQLETLTAYVKSIEDQLQTHNQLRSPMLLAFTPRGYNAGKAMSNWERKSSYLLRENVKFSTYVDCLQQAESRKQQIYTERDLAQRAARGELTDQDMEVSDAEEGDETIRPQ